MYASLWQAICLTLYSWIKKTHIHVLVSVMLNNMKFYRSCDVILELSPSFRSSLAFFRGGDVRPSGLCFGSNYHLQHKRSVVETLVNRANKIIRKERDKNGRDPARKIKPTQKTKTKKKYSKPNTMLQHALFLLLPVASISAQFFGSYIGFLLNILLNSRSWYSHYKALHGKAPSYIPDMTELVPDITECCSLSVAALWKCLVPEVWSMVSGV